MSMLPLFLPPGSRTSLRRRWHWPQLLLAAGLLLSIGAGGGCQVFRPYGTKQRMDPVEKKARKPVDKRTRRMTLAITTDSAGRVADVRFLQSSGSETVDNYVREDIRASYPGQAQPGTVTTLEITYSAVEGFSDPKVLSTVPAP